MTYTREQLEEILKLREEGLSIRAISRELGINHPLIQAMLTTYEIVRAKVKEENREREEELMRREMDLKEKEEWFYNAKEEIKERKRKNEELKRVNSSLEEEKRKKEERNKVLEEEQNKLKSEIKIGLEYKKRKVKINNEIDALEKEFKTLNHKYEIKKEAYEALRNEKNEEEEARNLLRNSNRAFVMECFFKLPSGEKALLAATLSREEMDMALEKMMLRGMWHSFFGWDITNDIRRVISAHNGMEERLKGENEERKKYDISNLIDNTLFKGNFNRSKDIDYQNISLDIPIDFSQYHPARMSKKRQKKK